MNHSALNGAGSDDRDFDDDVVKGAGLKPREQRHLRARFDLESSDGVGFANHIVGALVVLRNIVNAEVDVLMRFQHLKTFVERGQHAEAQHVDLQHF